MLESNKHPLHPQRVHLAPLFSLLVAPYKAWAEERGLVFGFDVPEDLEVVTDPDALKRIMVHLLDNAFKFTAAGAIHLDARYVQDEVIIRLSDTGCGMTGAALDRIFEAFAQGEAGLARSHEGSGLGLTLAQHLAAMLGATVSVTSTVEKGSTFSVHLPHRTQLRLTADREARRAARSTSQAGSARHQENEA